MAAALLLAATGCPLTECDCRVCLAGQAITLTVTDQDGAAPPDWLVDATVDGAPVLDITACQPENRVANTCTLGSDIGVYHIVVRAPGFADKEASVRVAVPAGQDCCGASTQCVPNALLSIALVPEDI